jgi:hypothetical protein
LNDLTKDELINSIKKERVNLEELIQKTPVKHLNLSILDDNWSIKDIIGHITYWDIQGTDWIESIVEGKSPDIIWAKESSIKELRQKQAEINAEVLKENQKKSYTLVLEEFTQSYQMLLLAIEKLSDDQIQKFFNFNYTEEPVSTRQIVNWRKSHYKSHREQLEKIISQL